MEPLRKGSRTAQEFSFLQSRGEWKSFNWNINLIDFSSPAERTNQRIFSKCSVSDFSWKKENKIISLLILRDNILRDPNHSNAL